MTQVFIKKCPRCNNTIILKIYRGVIVGMEGAVLRRIWGLSHLRLRESIPSNKMVRCSGRYPLFPKDTRICGKSLQIRTFKEVKVE